MRILSAVILSSAITVRANTAIWGGLLTPEVVGIPPPPHTVPFTLWYPSLTPIQPQVALPAPQGAIFDGPDPGLNAAITFRK